MSYQIYTTDAIILKRIVLDTDAFFVLFTLDFGLIYAKAISVRKVNSKLRFSLQQYFYSSISLVKGKSGFKITSAIFKDNLIKKDLSSVYKKAIANICKTVERLVSGQEKHPELFNILKDGFLKINDSKTEDVVFIEALILLLVLYHLGYVDMKYFDQRLALGIFDKEIIEISKQSYNDIIKTVNKGLSESQL